MPKLIKQSCISSDHWLPAEAEAGQAPPNCFPSLRQWEENPAGSRSAVQLEPGDGITALCSVLDTLQIVAIAFPAFMDGRGFSYARELRQRGYNGELRAVGNFMPDQLHYLRRCGFDAFQPADESRLDECLRQLRVFSEQYQASIDEPLPLFRRRGAAAHS